MAEARRIGRWVLLAGGTALFSLFLLSGDQGLVHYSRMKRYEGRLAARIEDLRAGNATLAAEVKRLESDPVTLEALARIQQMVRPGEVVYLLPAEPGEGAR